MYGNFAMIFRKGEVILKEKVRNLIFIFLGTFFVISLITIQIINIIQIKEDLAITLDLRLLFFQHNLNLFFCVLFLSIIPCIIYLVNLFITTSKNKENYNKIMNEKEAKKDLNCVQFDADKIKRGEYRSGLPIIVSRNKIWLDPSDSHNLILGTSNSGKTVSILFEMIELTRLAGESAVIVDLKGELSQKTYHKFKRDGYKCYCIDFINPECSDNWNPFMMGFNEYMKESAKVKEEYKRLEKYIKELKRDFKIKYGEGEEFYTNELNDNGDPIYVNGKIKTYPNYSKAEEYFNDVFNIIFDDTKGDNKIWNDFAKDLAVGIIFYLARLENVDYMNFDAVKKIIDLGDVPFKGRTTYLQKALEILMREDPSSKAVEMLSPYVTGAENTKKSIRQVFASSLNRYTMNQDIKNMLASTSSIDFSKIGDEKTVIFLKVHDEKSIYYPLVNLFMSQLYESLIANARQNKELKLKVPINILWDEFGSSPKFEQIKNLLSAGRSRGIRATLVIQGYDQIESRYGKDDARGIKNNTMNKVYLLSSDDETLKEISTLAGKRLIYTNGKPEKEPLFSIERLSKFQLGEALYIRQRKDPFYTNLLPYHDYVFYSDENSIFEVKPRKTAKWFNIQDYIRNATGMV